MRQPLPRSRCDRPASATRTSRGATLIEFVVVAPTLLAMALAMLQIGLAFQAKSLLNYATFEAARAGSVRHADLVRIRRGFVRAMNAYYGGGRTTAELLRSAATAEADLATALRIEILSPTRESFDDYQSPAAARRLGVRARVIPSTHLALFVCPADRPGCNRDPAANRSGQSLADANLLKLRVTWGLPAGRQVPLAGRLFIWAQRTLTPGDPDAFRRGLLAAGRIPLITHVTVRMQSDAIENSAISPGTRHDPSAPVDPSDPTPTPPPDCPGSAPSCPPEPDDSPLPDDDSDEGGSEHPDAEGETEC